MAPPKMSVTSVKPNLILMLRNVRNIIQTMKAIVFTPNFSAIIPGRGVTGVSEFCLRYLQVLQLRILSRYYLLNDG